MKVSISATLCSVCTYHHQHPKSITAQSLADIHVLAITVDGTAPIEKLFDSFIARQYDQCLCPEDETVDWAILFRPFLELLMGVSRGYLAKFVRIPDTKSHFLAY
jgi:hypothetical protein